MGEGLTRNDEAVDEKDCENEEGVRLQMDGEDGVWRVQAAKG